MGCCFSRGIGIAKSSKKEPDHAGIQPRQFIDMIRSSTPVEKVIPVDQFNLYGRLDRCEMMTIVCFNMMIKGLFILSVCHVVKLTIIVTYYNVECSSHEDDMHYCSTE
jgi:hypothetical protein